MLTQLVHTQDLNHSEILALLDRANAFLHQKATPPHLAHKRIIALFFENSTRTIASFQNAAMRLGASFSVFNVQKSSTSKGETLLDTLHNIEAMGVDLIITRHQHSSSARYFAQNLRCAFINAGSGTLSHPTQALLDLLTLYNHFEGKLEGKQIAIVGDIKNSRVANSNMELLPRFGMKILLVAPPHFLPPTQHPSTHSLTQALETADVIMGLRTQTERHSLQTYGSLRDYAKDFCLRRVCLQDRQIPILHPGPVHRNIDIEDALLDDPRSLVLEQVKLGVFLRMALMERCLTTDWAEVIRH
ncbi:aspartate carbamoyltransferase catalytic subunit [Helicobacter cynogastricus]|uniref:aspartate carbamoyltransferase catalytic subunit n=1 Tax=Helicobacter cynogastricus TaxID=329937 RepID=UPI000CF148F2|nr:aspartate carbamoyltransferase catalytic subunit [Helicobacter cynogastricus]